MYTIFLEYGIFEKKAFRRSRKEISEDIGLVSEHNFSLAEAFRRHVMHCLQDQWLEVFDFAGSSFLNYCIVN